MKKIFDFLFNALTSGSNESSKRLNGTTIIAFLIVAGFFELFFLKSTNLFMMLGGVALGLFGLTAFPGKS